MGEKTILVVDDEAVWLDLLARFFSGCGYTMVTAANCAQGMEQVRLHKPDCVILDYNLSDGKATEICSRLRACKERGGVPIIIFSSDPAAEACLEGEYRADRLFMKSDPLDGLLAVVRDLLGEKNPEPLAP